MPENLFMVYLDLIGTNLISSFIDVVVLSTLK